ncbi:glycogen synthase GlgA [Clostridium fermenticellae]|uniref:Glycogen synthase n=1 Tax=Clostridium fermenticellae TaxID=2068654 RepID=A0A386H3K8_9CLOT|nr:glycogen synthase GlgA [Clostridium fermenticellae]AYD40168.1 glycogen synthase GlgA [Clostridium fermenticellae]
MKKVLFAVSEAHPFAKTGGLGDVAYSLPKYLRKLGVDARVILPKYSQISSNFKSKMEHIKSFTVPVGWRQKYCGLEKYNFDDVPFYFVDNEYYFEKDKPYGFFDDGERFSFFSRAVLESIRYMGDFFPDIIHCNDWHTGIIPVLLNEHYKKSNEYTNVKTVFSIHNLKYQGIFPKEILGELLSLGDEYFSEDKIKYYDSISFMKAGINFSDIITTVSKSYAEEIKTPFYGETLDGLLNSKNYKLYGVVNGIDYEIFNPARDLNISYKYNSSTITQKVRNKIELQRSLNLPENKNIPVISMVTRLVKQKGLDLVISIIEELLSMDIQLVILGSGDENYQDSLQYFSHIYPSKLSVNIKFDTKLASKIYSGSDMFLMPSLFEPCGIGQLIALRYGTPPIVRETGGLKDTVIPFNEYTGEGNGFSFFNYDAHEMLNTIKYAVKIYHDKNMWSNISKNAMLSDNSWNNSAKTYIKLYESLT